MSRKIKQVKIEATTVGDIGSWSVGVGNIWERDYDGPGNQTVHGLSVTVDLWHDTSGEERKHILGPDCEMDLGKDGRWKLVEIVRGEGKENGHIVLKRMGLFG